MEERERETERMDSGGKRERWNVGEDKNGVG